MGTSVQRDDTCVMDHLDQNHHISGSLHDLVIVVVSGGKHWRSRGRPEETALGQRSVLGTVSGVQPPLCCAKGSSLACHLRQRRNLTVRRIHNQRTASASDDVSPLEPQLVDGTASLKSGRPLAGWPKHALLKFRCFPFAQHLLSGELARPLQRSGSGIRPKTL